MLKLLVVMSSNQSFTKTNLWLQCWLLGQAILQLPAQHWGLAWTPHPAMLLLSQEIAFTHVERQSSRNAQPEPPATTAGHSKHFIKLKLIKTACHPTAIKHQTVSSGRHSKITAQPGLFIQLFIECLCDISWSGEAPVQQHKQGQENQTALDC